MGIYKATFNIEVRASDEQSAFYEALDFLESNSPNDWLKIEKIDADVINSNDIYAKRNKHGIELLLFDDDKRECFCGWVEQKDNIKEE